MIKKRGFQEEKHPAFGMKNEEVIVTTIRPFRLIFSPLFSFSLSSWKETIRTTVADKDLGRLNDDVSRLIDTMNKTILFVILSPCWRNVCVCVCVSNAKQKDFHMSQRLDMQHHGKLLQILQGNKNFTLFILFHIFLFLYK